MKPNRIFDLRKQTGANQTEFGELIGVGIRSIQKYEKGESVPNGKALIKLLELDAKYPAQNDNKNKKPSYKGLSFEEILMFVLDKQEDFMSHKGFENIVEIQVAKRIAKISTNKEEFYKWLNS